MSVSTCDSMPLLKEPPSAANADVVNANGIKTHLASSMSTFFIVGKPTFIYNGPMKLSNHPSLPIIFLIVPFNKIFLFSKINYCHNL